MGRFSFVRWSLLFFVLILAAACGNGKSDGSSGGSVDRTPPTVISTTPANGNLNVDVNTAISATFSEGMDPASLSTSTFTLADNAGYLGGAVSYNAATRVVSFIPAASLSPDTRYFVTITTGAKDTAGNALAQGSTWVFWTNSGSDAIPPSVVANSIAPADGATNVPLSTHVTATFSESMDPASMDSFSFYLLEKNISFVPATVSYNDATKVATLVPSQPLKDDTSYTVWVTNWATDKAGNSLSPEVTWTFRTVDKTSPEVLLVSPASGAGGVAASSAVTVTFSESVDGTTVNASTFKLTGPSGDVAGTIAYNDATRVATFTPANVLQDDSIYFAIVTTGVKDLAGNALASQMSWNFITRDTVGPFVAYMFPKAGAVSVQVDTSVTATFSEPIDPVTVNTRTLKVEDVSNVPAVQVPGLVTYNAQTQVATFAPFSNLTNATQYRATVTTDVRDNSGNQLQAPTSWTFTTSSAASGGSDTLSPSVASTSPAKNALNVAVSPGGNLISVTFTEAVDPSTLSGNMELEGAENVGLVSYDETTLTATFLANLNFGARYVIVVTTGVKDLAGNSLDVEVRWPFTTAADATDKVAPTITGTTPASGANGVSLTSGVAVAFNEAMDAGTITTATVSLATADNEPVAGIVTYDAGTMTANFQPAFNLLPNTLYVVVVTTGVTDIAGNALAAQQSWSFRTLDLTPPAVLTFAPTNFATSVPVDSVVTATFSEAMNAATLTNTTFTLTDATGAAVVGAVSYDVPTKTATFTPGANLATSTEYLAKLTMAIADAAGNKMASQIAWRFTTIDNVAPTLVTRNPAPNAVAVSAAVKVQTMFSEAVDAATVNIDSVKLATVAGVQVAGTVAYDANTRVATFTPVDSLAALTAYRVTVTNQIRDLAGNQLAAAQTWDFTTASDGSSDTDAPTVVSTSPAKNAGNVPVAGAGNEISVTFSEAVDPSTLQGAITVEGASQTGVVSYDEATLTATFTAALGYDTRYVIVVATGVKDLAGNSLDVGIRWPFTTAADATDKVAPTITGKTPDSGVNGVSLTSGVSVTFSEAMDAGTITTATVSLLAAGNNPVTGSVTYDAATMTATFYSESSLLPNTLYVAVVTTGVMDIAGNALAAQESWSFRTLDLSAPTVLTFAPANFATSVPIDSVVTATFTEAMDATTLTNTTFTLTDPTGGSVAGAVTYNPSTKTATFTPGGNLTASTEYLVKLSMVIADTAGNKMASQVLWRFTTVDNSAPTLVARNPAPNAAAVSPDVKVQAVFSEAIDPTTVNLDSVKLATVAGVQVVGTVVYDENTRVMTFTPTGALAALTAYRVTVTSQMRDLAGNRLAAAQTWDFTTASGGGSDSIAPAVLSTSPAQDAVDVGVDPLGNLIHITFTEAIDPVTLPGAISILGAASVGKISYDEATFTASVETRLDYRARYVIVVTTGVKDLAGNPLDVEVRWPFYTVDNERPSITEVFPADGDTQIDVGEVITATFSEPMDVGTITNSSFKLTDGLGLNVAGAITYDSTLRMAIFTPNVDLLPDSRYTARVTMAVSDPRGNPLVEMKTWSFTTLDTIPPTVVGTIPLANASSISVDAPIQVLFSEVLDQTSINFGSFRLATLAGEQVLGAVAYDPATNVASFTPTEALSASTAYRASVTETVRDLGGNYLAVVYTWDFTTADPPAGMALRVFAAADLSPPTVRAVSPLDGAVQVPLSGAVSATFSEPMDAATIQQDVSFIVMDDSGTPVAGALTYDDASNTATFTSNNLLDADTTYLVRVTLGATDVAGNLLAQEKLWGFRTVDSTPPTVLSMSPAPLAATVSIESLVEVVFSEAMAASTLNQATFILTDVLTDVDVAGSVLYIAATRTAIFMPYLALDPLTQYRATLTTGVTDSGSNPLAADVTWTFTTDTESSIRPPSVTAVTPANGAANVALNAAITAAFSKPVDASTLTTDSFVLTDGNGNVVAGGVSYDAATTTLTFVPDAALASDSFYVAQILASVTDTEGVAMARGEVWSFRTTAVGVTLPAVTATVPATGTLNVAEGSDVTVTFNKAMDPATINASTITLSSALGAVAGRVTYDTGTDVATFTPLLPLMSNTFYTATVTAGAKDLSGRALSALVWSFTTADSSPTVAAVTPTDKSTGFAVTGKIYIDFSEDMDPLTINATNIVMTGPGGPLAGTVSYTFNAGLGVYRATFTPNTTLSTNSYYVMQVTTGVKDLSGNPLDNPFVWSFTTNVLVDMVPPTVMGNIPWNGATHMSVVNKVSATFSEAMDTSSLAAAFTLFDVTNAAVVPGRIDYDNTTHVATFVPDAQLLNDTDYSATISILATDVAGNAIEQPVNWSFTTIDDSKTTYDFSGYFTGQYISSATIKEPVYLVLLQPAGKSTDGPPPVDVNATFIGNFSTDSGILGTVSGIVSGDAASITVTYSKSGCTGTFSGSAVGLLSGGSNITMNFIGQACDGPEFVSIGVLQTTP